jgi:uncharacterized protein (TIGR02147 family)
MSDWKPDIFGYTDYRAYLADYYEAAKAHTRTFSYRNFARRCGFSSPNFLKLVIDGERNLGPNSIERFAKALQLDEEEAAFFGRLVSFNQATTVDERHAAYDEMASMRRFRLARRIDGELFDYLSHWYMPAIREMAARADFRDDPAWIAPQLIPAISPAQAADALNLLLRLGLLVREEDGRLRRGEPSLTTGHEVRSLAVAAYHRQMLLRAADSIDLVPSNQRDISALTVCVRPETVARLKEEIHAFRERLLELCDREEDADVVYQLNIQLFPLSRPAKETP